MVIAFNKPYGVISQATSGGSRNRALAQQKLPDGVSPIGTLDEESEGLLFLSDEPELAKSVLSPEVYWIEVANVPSESALNRLQKGIAVEGHKAKPCRAWIMAVEPDLPPLPPSVKGAEEPIPRCWIGVTIPGAKGNQLRLMTAEIGHPTLRLVRVQISCYPLGELAVGEWCQLKAKEKNQIFGTEKTIETPWRYKNLHRKG